MLPRAQQAHLQPQQLRFTGFVPRNNQSQRINRRQNRTGDSWQEVISELRRASPSVARLTDLAVSKEREAFEEKIRRALFLLRKKDAKIRELGDDLASRRRPVRERSVRGAGRGAGGEDPGGGDDDFEEEKASFIKRLEACVANQAEQIEALVEEVSRGATVRTACPLGGSHPVNRGRVFEILYDKATSR